MAKAIAHLTIPLSRILGPTRYGWDLHLGNPQETLIQTSNLPIHSRHYCIYDRKWSNFSLYLKRVHTSPLLPVQDPRIL